MRHGLTNWGCARQDSNLLPPACHAGVFSYRPSARCCRLLPPCRQGAKLDSSSLVRGLENEGEWIEGDSNPRPSACHADALPTELSTQVPWDGTEPPSSALQADACTM